MRTAFCFIVAIPILLLCSCGKIKQLADTNLTCTVNTYSAPISAIAKSGIDDVIYIGLDNGVIIKKMGDKNSIISSDKKTRIYDILEYNKDSLFVGTRDGGLKLLTIKDDSCTNVETFSIKNKTSNYSVYSIAIDTLNKILFAGSSNGVYKLDLRSKNKCDTLENIAIVGLDTLSRVNKLIWSKGYLYIASNSGLFRDSTPMIPNVRINNIRLENDSIYALQDKSIVKIFQQGDSLVQEKIIDGKYYSYENGLHGEKWILENHCVRYGKESYPLPNGISTQGKQIAMKDSNFYYVAYREELLAFPLHQNTSGISSCVIAVSNKSKEGIAHFITSDLRLHKYAFGEKSAKSESLGALGNLGIDDGVVKLITTSDGTLFLATKKSIYQIKNNKAIRIANIDNHEDNDFNTLFFSDSDSILYVGTRHYLGYKDYKNKSVGDTLFSAAVKTDTTDLYVVDILQDPNGTIYCATLNKGLFYKNKGSADFKEKWNSEQYGSTFDMALCKNDVLLNTSSGIIYNNNEESDFKDFKDIKSIYSDVGTTSFFVLNFHGLSLQGLAKSDFGNREANQTLFRDISFDKARICIYGETALLGAKSGLFLYDKGKLKTIYIEVPKDYPLPYIFVVIFVVVGLIITAIIYFILDKKREKRRKIEMKKDIQKTVEDIKARIENIKKYPKIDNVQNRLDESIVYLNKIETQEEMYTTTNADNLKNQVSDIEQVLANSMGHLIVQMTPPEVEKLIDDLNEAVKKKYKVSIIKEECDKFVNAHPILKQLSFMQRNADGNRFYVAILLFIPNINAKTICDALELDDPQYVNRFKYAITEQIEKLYLKNPEMKKEKIIEILYNRTKSKRSE